jgi:plasmid maintenance system antidote protein VapI
MAKTNKTLPLQMVFIQKLKENLPPNLGLAEEIASILEISTDSAYRRIRGETELSIDEVFKLTKKYNISVDSVFANLGDTVTFTYTKLTDDADNFDKYLNRIYNHVKAIASFKDKKITYIAEEVPLFYSFFTEKLTQFKLFYWQRSVLNVPNYQGKKFEFGVIPEHQVKLAMSSLAEYQSIPSVEVWTNETILTVLKQIEFYTESGVFKSKQDALELVEEVRKMAQYLENCAETGRKLVSSPNENLLLYNSEVVLGTNCIYITMGEAKYAYITFNTLNSLTTNNHEFCEETEHWVKNIIKKSTLISGVAEKQRFQFFSKMYKNIDNCFERIKNL